MLYSIHAPPASFRSPLKTPVRTAPNGWRMLSIPKAHPSVYFNPRWAQHPGSQTRVLRALSSCILKASSDGDGTAFFWSRPWLQSRATDLYFFLIFLPFLWQIGPSPVPVHDRCLSSCLCAPSHRAWLCLRSNLPSRAGDPGLPRLPMAPAKSGEVGTRTRSVLKLPSWSTPANHGLIMGVILHLDRHHTGRTKWCHFTPVELN